MKAWKGDAAGNLIFKGTARNFNPNMCGAAKITVAEVEELVPVGESRPKSNSYSRNICTAYFSREKFMRKELRQRTVRQRSLIYVR